MSAKYSFLLIVSTVSRALRFARFICFIIWIYFILALTTSFPFITQKNDENDEPDLFFPPSEHESFCLKLPISYRIRENEKDTKSDFISTVFCGKRSVKITLFLPLNYQMEKLCLCRCSPPCRTYQTKKDANDDARIGWEFFPSANNNKSSANGTVHYLASHKYISIRRK